MENTQENSCECEPQTASPRKKLLKIIVPILLVIIVAGLWFLKNSQKPDLPVVDDSEFGLNVTDELDLEQLTSHGLPIMIDFGAGYCPPCKVMSYYLPVLNEEFRDRAIVKYVDVGEYAEIALDYPVTMIPTQVFINGDGTPYMPEGKPLVDFNYYSHQDTGEHLFTTHVGLLTEEEIRAILEDMEVS